MICHLNDADGVREAMARFFLHEHWNFGGEIPVFQKIRAAAEEHHVDVVPWLLNGDR